MRRWPFRFATYSKRADFLHCEIRSYRLWRFSVEYKWDPKRWPDAHLGVGDFQQLTGATTKWLTNDFDGDYEMYVSFSCGVME